MKSFLLCLMLLVAGGILLPAAQTLTLTWSQPPGFGSTLYTTTNIAQGQWRPVTNSAPPVNIETTNNAAFFYVVVMPTNAVNSAVIYTNNPNSEGVWPTFTNLPAVAYCEDGSQPLYVWNIRLQTWN